MKREIQNKIVKYLDSIFEDIDQKKNELQKVNTDITKKGAEYLDVIKQLNITQEDVKKCEDYMSSENNKLDKREKELDGKFIKLENSSVKKIKEQEQLLENISILETKKKDIELQIKSITPLKIIKESLEKEVETLTTFVTKTRDEGNADIKDVQEGIVELESQKQIIRQEIAELKKEHKQELGMVLPKQQELEKREAVLAAKENDFNVIVSRHNKMFVGSSAKFKVK